jgi:hypothetical protein
VTTFLKAGGIDPAEHTRLCGVAPGSKVSLGKLLEHGFVKLSICEQSLEAGVLLLEFLEALGLCRLWAPPDYVYIPP